MLNAPTPAANPLYKPSAKLIVSPHPDKKKHDAGARLLRCEAGITSATDAALKDHHVVFYIDTSGSMANYQRLTMAKEAAKMLFANLSATAGANMSYSVFSYNTKPELIISKADQKAVLAKIDPLKADGLTDFYGAIKQLPQVVDAKNVANTSVVVMGDGAHLINEIQKKWHPVVQRGDYVATVLLKNEKGEFIKVAADRVAAADRPKAYQMFTKEKSNLPALMAAIAQTKTTCGDALPPFFVFGVGTDHQPADFQALAAETGGFYDYAETSAQLQDKVPRLTQLMTLKRVPIGSAELVIGQDKRPLSKFTTVELNSTVSQVVEIADCKHLGNGVHVEFAYGAGANKTKHKTSGFSECAEDPIAIQGYVTDEMNRILEGHNKDRLSPAIQQQLRELLVLLPAAPATGVDPYSLLRVTLSDLTTKVMDARTLGAATSIMSSYTQSPMTMALYLGPPPVRPDVNAVAGAASAPARAGAIAGGDLKAPGAAGMFGGNAGDAGNAAGAVPVTTAPMPPGGAPAPAAGPAPRNG